MEQRTHFVTLATPDLDASRRFYRDGLGWVPLADVPGEIVFFQTGPGLVLGFFEESKFREDMDGAVSSTSTTGVTLSHNVGSPGEVDALVDAAVRAGARLVKSPRPVPVFDGYHGHFADPNGVVWEVCHNPGWSVDDAGRVSLGAGEESN
ncbi:putative glyoxalase/bleomycin resistance protein [Streptomyces daqingensis]|uniref:Glyoxalase/bleomycin resistance protein n=1 Tax=Streptomyces daqingensis TaxID=1472640 RepID=A0ABQ2M4D8_9ACTN|nr:VOC family protein [Streptomyces daqingensis]GGO46748.1 putative glyoxalase/bleomycin resistance protein [Streptomyces daqingensis]